jgi:two-component system, LuxR family, response regulator FixJ
VSYAVVHLIDDDLDIRQSLSFMLISAGFAVRVYPSATAFLEGVSTLQPGCVISDLRMPGVDGIELLVRLKALRILLPVIIMTGHADVPLAVKAMKEGAFEFIEKPFDGETLISTINLAIARQSKAGNRDSDVTQVKHKIQSLSGREREVFAGLVTGLPNKTIAYDLHLSPRTVEVHRANVMNKMGAQNLPALVRMALMGGLLSG